MVISREGIDWGDSGWIYAIMSGLHEEIIHWGVGCSLRRLPEGCRKFAARNLAIYAKISAVKTVLITGRETYPDPSEGFVDSCVVLALCTPSFSSLLAATVIS